ncbi:MAG: AraC family transcriptional regulator [Pseudomonadota bacterium]
MYEPKGHGRDRELDQVAFTEVPPPAHLAHLVHRYLELRTRETLAEDNRFHALPDACVYAVFDQSNPVITGVTGLRAAGQELNLGRSFHFVNIRFRPGIWDQAKSAVSQGIIDAPYAGDLPLRAVNQRLMGQSFDAQQAVLTEFVESLVTEGILRPNPVTARIFAALDDIVSVGDMAQVAGLSPRQLQRVLKRSTGFAPHDFLKVLRVQQSLLGTPSLAYSDQAHFIRSFREATGYTPGRHGRKFDV